jgi:phosphopantothenoylcysteine decarboxylase / phosphopantothenate---cysteine ligase
MNNSNILVGVTGGIAAYKACDLVRLFVKGGHSVRVLMTRNAAEFVSPLSLEVLSQNPIPRGMFDGRSDPAVGHVEAAQWADCVVVAPATANLIGKLAAGVADDLLTTMLLAVPTGRPVLLAPAMNTHMWENPAVQRNLKVLLEQSDGRFSTVGPVVKELACGDLGMGGMASVEDVFQSFLDVMERKRK